MARFADGSNNELEIDVENNDNNRLTPPGINETAIHEDNFDQDELDFPSIGKWQSRELTSFVIKRDFGFSFQLPSWYTIVNGNTSNGHIRMMIHNTIIDISWIRDRGIEPHAILKNIFNFDKLDASSVEFGTVYVGSAIGKFMDMPDIDTGFLHSKRSIIWISANSDRLFLASLCSSKEKYSQSIKLFDTMIKTFEDDFKFSSFEHRSTINDSWAIILRDFLSSYRYESKSLASTKEIRMIVRTYQGKYGCSDQFMPERDISFKFSEEDFIRAAFIWNLLTTKGYDCRFIQKSGRVWVLICDQYDRWQAISPNLADPQRGIGILIEPAINSEFWYNGIMYDDCLSLAKENSIEIKILEGYAKKICEDSRYVELHSPQRRDYPWVRKLEDLIKKNNYKHKYYQENAFVCANTSQILWATLRSNGYDSRIMTGYEGHPLGDHMWVVIKYPNEKEVFIAMEATASDERGRLISLGEIVWSCEYYFGIMYMSSQQFSTLHPKQGMSLYPHSHVGYIEPQDY